MASKIEVAIMIEGQNGLNWPRWKRIVQLVEEAGYVGLFRSDHYTNANPPDIDSLELWISLAWVASHTRQIEFGPLVSPISFRHPTHTARMARDVDDLSGGRLYLGLGAGWQEREHINYGWELLDIPARFKRFQEGLEIISGLFASQEPVAFDGEYFSLQDAILLPRPSRPGGPPIIIGGNGYRWTLPLAARYAHEWNGIFLPPDQFLARSSRLDELLESSGRTRDEVRRSLMTGCIFGRDERRVREILEARNRTNVELRKRGVIVGTAPEIVDQLGTLAEVGVYRVMLQWLDLDDLDGLEALAREALPQIGQ